MTTAASAPAPHAGEVRTLHLSELIKRPVTARGGEPLGRISDVVVRLDRVSADDVAHEAESVGFVAEPHLSVRETEQYLGSTVVALRAP